MSNTPPTIPEISNGTRITDFGAYDITVTGMTSGSLGLVAWGPNQAQGGKIQAVKLPRPDRLATVNPQRRAAILADFERHALTWCHLWPHPFIVKVETVLRLPTLGGLPAIILEYVPNGSLRDPLLQAHRPGSTQALGLEAVFAWGRMVAAALAAIHQPDPDLERPEPLVYGDLKPENVLLNAHGWAMLTDTRLTRSLTPLGDSASLEPLAISSSPAASPALTPDASEILAHMGSRGSVAGTPPYMAPEQWLGFDAVEPATDIYALGVMLFELFAGVGGRAAYPHTPDPLLTLSAGPFAAWCVAHANGPTRHLADPEVAALSEGPLVKLIQEGRQQQAEQVLAGLDMLIGACLAVSSTARPTARQVQEQLAGLANQIGLEPLSIPEYPRTPEHLATYWERLGSTYGELEHPEERLRLQRKAVGFTPENPERRATLGNALSQLGVVEQHEAQQVARTDDQVRARSLQAQAQAHLEEAVRIYQESETQLTLDWQARYPYLATSLPYNLGGALLDLRRYPEAVIATQRSLAANPTYTMSYRQIALAYLGWSREPGTSHAERVELLEQAQAAIRQALSLAPQFTAGQQLLAETQNELSSLASPSTELPSTYPPTRGPLPTPIHPGLPPAPESDEWASRGIDELPSDRPEPLPDKEAPAAGAPSNDWPTVEEERGWAEPPPASAPPPPAPAPEQPAAQPSAPPPAPAAPPADRAPSPHLGEVGGAASDQPQPPGRYRLVEYLQFSAYHPNEAPVEAPQTLLVYTHLPQQIAQVRQDAGTFTELGSAPRIALGQSLRKIARNVEITVEPHVEGVTFSPAQDSFIWRGEWHRSLFRYSGARELAGTVRKGWIDIYAERVSPICTLEVTFSFHDGMPTASLSVPHGIAVTSNSFDTVFISYSHRDQEAMRQARETYQKLGITTYHDDLLEAGENYERRLAGMIRAANVFHLLWSDTAARSNEVRKEWLLALASEKGERFIRPWYWQQPIAPPPPELSARKISFRYEHLRRRLLNPTTWF